MTIFWFRRDLRLEDNHGLYEALANSKAVLPIFIFDKMILDELPQDDARVTFIYECLVEINTKLQKINKSLAVFYGKPEDIFEQIIADHNLEAVYTNHDYEPYALKRDTELKSFFDQKSISFQTFKDQVVFERNEVVKDDGTPYVVYTPFSKKWKEKLKNNPIENYKSEALLEKIAPHSYPFIGLNDFGFKESAIKVRPYDITKNIIENYTDTRNFPAVDKTSYASVHLRFGTISTRKLVQYAAKFEDETYLKELIWREFFMQILWHFPNTVHNSFRPKYDAIQWKNNEELFKKWCQGKTGYPIVDAGMRQLNKTGYMHNRVRMVVASFLTKHLLIDWRWGETYFAQKLLDYEQSSNVGNWQWAAGSGVDAAPYFRIFNPTEQVKKFDKDLKYIKKWVPELETLHYPDPIVDHKTARELCLKTYKEAVG
jgi:deoxyribodipyrimidine photo-lyase